MGKLLLIKKKKKPPEAQNGNAQPGAAPKTTIVEQPKMPRTGGVADLFDLDGELGQQKTVKTQKDIDIASGKFKVLHPTKENVGTKSSKNPSKSSGKETVANVPTPSNTSSSQKPLFTALGKIPSTSTTQNQENLFGEKVANPSNLGVNANANSSSKANIAPNSSAIDDDDFYFMGAGGGADDMLRLEEDANQQEQEVDDGFSSFYLMSGTGNSGAVDSKSFKISSSMQRSSSLVLNSQQSKPKTKKTAAKKPAAKKANAAPKPLVPAFTASVVSNVQKPKETVLAGSLNYKEPTASKAVVTGIGSEYNRNGVLSRKTRVSEGGSANSLLKERPASKRQKLDHEGLLAEKNDTSSANGPVLDRLNTQTSNSSASNSNALSRHDSTSMTSDSELDSSPGSVSNSVSASPRSAGNMNPLDNNLDAANQAAADDLEDFDAALEEAMDDTTIADNTNLLTSTTKKPLTAAQQNRAFINATKKQVKKDLALNRRIQEKKGNKSSTISKPKVPSVKARLTGQPPMLGARKGGMKKRKPASYKPSLKSKLPKGDMQKVTSYKDFLLEEDGLSEEEVSNNSNLLGGDIVPLEKKASNTASSSASSALVSQLNGKQSSSNNMFGSQFNQSGAGKNLIPGSQHLDPEIRAQLADKLDMAQLTAKLEAIQQQSADTVAAHDEKNANRKEKLAEKGKKASKNTTGFSNYQRQSKFQDKKRVMADRKEVAANKRLKNRRRKGGFTSQQYRY